MLYNRQNSRSIPSRRTPHVTCMQLVMEHSTFKNTVVYTLHIIANIFVSVSLHSHPPKSCFILLTYELNKPNFTKFWQLAAWSSRHTVWHNYVQISASMTILVIVSDMWLNSSCSGNLKHFLPLFPRNAMVLGPYIKEINFLSENHTGSQGWI